MRLKIKGKSRKSYLKKAPKKRNVILRNSMKNNSDSKSGKSGKGTLRKISAIVIIVILCVIIAKAYDYICTSPKFALKYIVIKGDNQCEKNEVLKASQIQTGVNIFRLNTSEITERLKLNYQIYDVEVKRKIPDTLTITLVKRHPVAYIGEEKIYQIDGSGIVYAGLLKEPNSKLPVIIGYAVDSKSIGKKRNDAGITAALNLLKEMSEGCELSAFKLDISDCHDIKIITSGEAKVFMGGDDFGSKIKRLEMVIEDAKSRNKEIKTVDLRFREEASVMLKS